MKILIIYASAGAGHMKAAEAIYDGILPHSQHQVTLIDALDLTSRHFKKLYQKSYTFMVSKISGLWAFSFGSADVPCLQPLVRFIRRIYNGINARKLHRYIIEQEFDCIVSTHFMPVEIVSALKRKGRVKTKLICCVTDFDVHRIWLGDGVDQYTVASDWTKGKLKSLGINEEKISVTGIPTNEKFSLDYHKSELRRQLGLKESAFTVLVATGSFGIGPIDEILETLKDFQVIVVCGHNKNLFEKLSQMENDNAKICGLVDNMYELMAASNVMITKPGGLSISEALVRNLPLIFFNPIPGQETNNIKVLKEYGIGLSDCSVQEMAQELEKFKASPDLYHVAVEQTKFLARPQAVSDIIKIIEK